MANVNLTKAKAHKNDEFYTVYHYIQKEINAYIEYNPDVFRNKTILLPCDDPEWSNFTKFFAQNFERLGLKKLISTSYSISNKRNKYEYFRQISVFDTNLDRVNEVKELENGKIFTLTRDINHSGCIDYEDLEWDYLEGDGDFRSEEVSRLRDESDIIITNPPFSLFREFIAWVFEANKNLVVIGNQNAITYKEIFPLIKGNKLWLGATNNDKDMVFEVPEGAEIAQGDRDKAEKLGYVGNYTRLGNACWFSNLDHGRRHEAIPLMTRSDNLRYNKKLIKKLRNDYQTDDYPDYDNYNAMEVPFVDAIPDDNSGIMGVPITFLSKYNPDQFEILGMTKTPICYNNNEDARQTATYENAIQFSRSGIESSGSKVNDGSAILVKSKPSNKVYYVANNADSFLVAQYPRILIRKK